MKTLVTILLASFLPALAWAQGPLLWDKTLGGSGWDEPHGVVATPDGGCIVAGHSDSGKNGDKSESGHGSTDFWIVKLDAQGDKVWDRSIGGNNSDILKKIIQTSDGNYLLIGLSNSNKGGDKSENSKGELDIWIVKIDQNGTKLWDKTYGGDGHDEGLTAIIAPDGGFLIAGGSTSNISGDKSESSKGGSDFWLLKLDQNGNKLWDRTIGGSATDYCTDISITTDGHIILAGLSQSPKGGDKSEDKIYSYDGWVVKLATDGTKTWDKTIGNGDSFYHKASVLATLDNGCLFTASVGFEPIKLDADGNEQWRKDYKGDACYALMNATDGGFILAGGNQSNKGQYKSEDSRGDQDFWVIKLDAQGRLTWDKTLGGNKYDAAHSVVETTDKGLVLVGRTNSDSSGEKTENRRGQIDYWVVKLGPEGPPLQWRNLITRPTTSSQANGVIRMAVYGGKAPYEYSIDDGANWQSGRSFGDLPAGAHKAAVRDASGAVIHVDVLLRER